MVIAILVKTQVLARATHLVVHPASTNDDGLKGKGIYALCTFSILALAYVLSAAVPFFDYFTSILGAWMALPTFHWPALFLWILRARAGNPLKLMEKIFMCILCFGFGTLILFFGTWNAIDGIIDSYGELGGPFSCQCHDIWESGCLS
eukprot:Awhi_evm2s4637